MSGPAKECRTSVRRRRFKAAEWVRRRLVAGCLIDSWRRCGQRERSCRCQILGPQRACCLAAAGGCSKSQTGPSHRALSEPSPQSTPRLNGYSLKTRFPSRLALHPSFYTLNEVLHLLDICSFSENMRFSLPAVPSCASCFGSRHFQGISCESRRGRSACLSADF